MSRTSARLVGIGLLGVSLVHCGSRPAPFETELPAPSTTGRMSLEEALATRRSIRSYDDEPLSTTAIGQLAWAAQGITDPRGYRTAPSAGALYPLEIFVVTRDGVDRYVPQGHKLVRVWERDVRAALADAAFHQDEISAAPVDLVVVGHVARTKGKYGERAERFVAMEAGHAAENVLLQARALGLGAVSIGGFADNGVRAALHLGEDATPYYVIPIGHPR